jgi:hypothetical protein
MKMLMRVTALSVPHAVAAGGGFVSDIFCESSTRRTPRAVLTSCSSVVMTLNYKWI